MNLILHTDNQLQQIESIKDSYTVHAKTFINFLKRTGQAINEDSIRETFKGNKYLFETSSGKKYYNPYVTTEIKKVGKRINRHLSAHNLRHSYATNLIKMYPDKIKEISLSMGHADISTCINYYLKVSLSPEEIFKHAAA